MARNAGPCRVPVGDYQPSESRSVDLCKRVEHDFECAHLELPTPLSARNV